MNITRNWKPYIAVGCNHGKYINRSVEEQLFEFINNLKPVARVHLGDFIDTEAWRSGAGGTPDQAKDLDEDFNAGANFLRRLEPTLVFLGNHDYRPYKYMEHGCAIVRKAASACVGEIDSLIQDELKAEFVRSYQLRKSWRMIGNTAFGHGFMFNQQAARDHAKVLGVQTVIAHIHTLSAKSAPSIGAPIGYSAGLLADIDQLSYAGQRESTAGWINGWVYGWYCDDATTVNLHRAQVERLTIPVAESCRQDGSAQCGSDIGDHQDVEEERAQHVGLECPESDQLP